MMKRMKTVKLLVALLFHGVHVLCSAQNNLEHTEGYKTSGYGAMVSYTKAGKGKEKLILIAGLGFDGSVFSDFVERNKKSFTMYSVTLPGYGNTTAPPMPDSAHASYGLQYWNNGAVEGIKKMIEKERLRKPVIVGHFVQGAQIALRLAAELPDVVGGVITVGAPAKFISVMNGQVTEYPLQSSIGYIDKYTAPKWFGPMSKAKFDQGNYLPEVYSLNTDTGDSLWKISAGVPLPVYIRYLCEFFASDITLIASQVRCPVLIVRAMFSPQLLHTDVNSYIKPQFIDAWDRMAKANPKIVLKDVLNSATFIWKDQPAIFDELVRGFMKLP